MHENAASFCEAADSNTCGLQILTHVEGSITKNLMRRFATIDSSKSD